MKKPSKIDSFIELTEELVLPALRPYVSLTCRTDLADRVKGQVLWSVLAPASLCATLRIITRDALVDSREKEGNTPI